MPTRIHARQDKGEALRDHTHCVRRYPAAFVSGSLVADTLVVFLEHRTLLDLADTSLGQAALAEGWRGLAQTLGHLAA